MAATLTIITKGPKFGSCGQAFGGIQRNINNQVKMRYFDKQVYISINHINKLDI